MSELTIAVAHQSTSPFLRLRHYVADAQSPLDRMRDDRADESTNELADTGRNSRRSVWALADQGVVSLGNCATSVLLARSLAVAEFGIFALLLEEIGRA